MPRKHTPKGQPDVRGMAATRIDHDGPWEKVIVQYGQLVSAIHDALLEELGPGAVIPTDDSSSTQWFWRNRIGIPWGHLPFFMPWLRGIHDVEIHEDGSGGVFYRFKAQSPEPH